MSSRTHCHRQVFRITYPEGARPQFDTYSGTYEIVDCSEAGLRYLLNGAKPPSLSTVIHGRIRFATESTGDLSGFVLRASKDHVAIRFAKRLSPAIILNEQRWLRQPAK